VTTTEIVANLTAAISAEAPRLTEIMLAPVSHRPSRSLLPTPATEDRLAAPPPSRTLLHNRLRSQATAATGPAETARGTTAIDSPGDETADWDSLTVLHR
jgi:hypothetical protein